MNGNRIRQSTIGDKLLFVAAIAGLVLWSLLAHDRGVSAAGICVAIWFPLSVLLYRFVLRWLPVIGCIRATPSEETSQGRREITAGCLLVASFSIVFLACLPPLHAVEDIIGLNFACLAAVLDRREGWLPNYILIPMLLTGLISGMVNDNVNTAISGAAIAWGITSLALVFISVSLRANFLSGGDMTMATACGAWAGSDNVTLFLLLSACLHWMFCVVMRHFSIQPRRYIDLDRPGSGWVQPMGPSFAFSLAIVLLLHNMPDIPDWKYFIPGY